MEISVDGENLVINAIWLNQTINQQRAAHHFINFLFYMAKYFPGFIKFFKS